MSSYLARICLKFVQRSRQLVDWAELAGIEVVIINKNTSTLQFRNELRWNDAVWKR